MMQPESGNVDDAKCEIFQFKPGEGTLSSLSHGEQRLG